MNRVQLVQVTSQPHSEIRRVNSIQTGFNAPSLTALNQVGSVFFPLLISAFARGDSSAARTVGTCAEPVCRGPVYL